MPSRSAGRPARPTVAALCAALLTLAACTGVAEADATVALGEWFVGAPAALDAGTVTLDVRNHGRAHHNLSICPTDGSACTGPAVTQRVLVAPEDAREPDDFPDETRALVLGAGWETSVEAALEPGSYRLYCAIPNHPERGMDTVVDVTG